MTHQMLSADLCYHATAGEISPITRSLWFARHQLNQEVLEEARLPEPVPKPPQETAVLYSFSSDPILREQARK